MRMSTPIHRAVVALAALLGTLAVLAPSHPARGSDTPPSEGLERLAGGYVFAGGDRERGAVNDAIDSVVDRLNLFIREIARGRIREAIQPEPRVEVDVVGAELVRLRLGDWQSPVAHVDGTPLDVRGPDGSDTRFSVRYRNGRLATRATTSRGTREIWLSLSDDDAGWLFSQVRVSSNQLPESIRYTLSYRRAR